MNTTFKLTLLLMAALLLACQTVSGLLSPPTATPPPSSMTAPSLPTPTAASPADTTPALESFSLSQDQQQEILDDLWNIIATEYLYPELNGLDWDEIHAEYTDQIAGGLSDQEFYSAMDEMIFRLGDDHSAFLSPEQVAEEEAVYAGDLDYVGIGVFIGGVPERERAVIYMIIPGGSAEAAGLQARDSVLTVDGQPVLDEFGYPTDTIRGPEGTQVVLEVQTPGQAPRTVTLTRTRITGTLPVPHNLLTTPAGQRIGYIFIPTFADSNVDGLVRDALENLTAGGPLDGLILDNRHNDGGFESELRGTLRLFTNGVVGYFVNRQAREPLRVSGLDINGSQTVPLVVLVGENTYSYGEVFSGVLGDQNRATLIGETTLGNVETLWSYDFSDGSRAWLAHDTFSPANDPEIDWEETGIVVDIVAPTAWDLTTQAEDPAILAALEFFDE